MQREYQICTRCIMDTTDPDIKFDENGICNHCRRLIEKLRYSEPYCLSPMEKNRRLEQLVGEVKRKGKNKKYDCVIGVSGGLDSTYVAYLTKKLGLRPLAVHLDNGWDSELAANNVKKALKKLGIDLFTYVLDWDEFRDLQLAFLKASTPDSEIPTDHAIAAALFNVAKREGIKYIIFGHNVRTEGLHPKTWARGHIDWKYIKSISKIYGSVDLKNFPHFHFHRFRYNELFKIIFILDYIDYDRKEAMKIIQQELDWNPYGSKHHESVYTRFLQSYILPRKFNVDKRKAYLSALICSGQSTRDEALEEIKKDICPPELLEKDKKLVLKKLEITQDQFDEIMELTPKTFDDYPSFENSMLFKFTRKVYRFVKPKVIKSKICR